MEDEGFLKDPQAFDVEKLLTDYPDTFKRVDTDDTLYFVEIPTEENKKRQYRYIATKMLYPPENLLEDEQNLIALEIIPLERSSIWKIQLKENDLKQISRRIDKIKKRIKHHDKAIHPLTEKVNLEDGPVVWVTYLEDAQENTMFLTDDLD